MALVSFAHECQLFNLGHDHVHLWSVPCGLGDWKISRAASCKTLAAEVNHKLLIFLGVSIMGTSFALLATYPEYRGMTDAVANFGAMVSLLLALYAFWRER